MKRFLILTFSLLLLTLFGCVSTTKNRPDTFRHVPGVEQELPKFKKGKARETKKPEIYSQRKENRFSSREMLFVNKPISSIFKGDSLSGTSLQKAVEQSIRYLKRIPESSTFRYGKLEYTAKEIVASMQLFLNILNKRKTRKQFLSQLDEQFHLFASPANHENGVMFTGYYEPQFKGSLQRTAEYNVPVYQLPDNRLVLRLGNFRKSLVDRTIIYRKENGKLLPYFTRQEIMEEAVLEGKGFEIAWMKDPVDLFFIQVQGSGILILPSGKQVKILYQGSNGRPYSSIGKYLIENKKLTLEEVSMGSIRKYLSDHPKERDQILYHNESYIFFRLETDVTEGPVGNINVPITALRSIATDTRVFPKGGLAYISTEVPNFDKNLKRIQSKPLSHFVLNQDTGGAIIGVDRVDLFWGKGNIAEMSAGSMRSFGKIYFLIAKKNVLAAQNDEMP